jgi:hypothetical protein
MGEGSYVCNPGFSFSPGNGTSYATPILAGAVACLWQANPTKTNMQILQALKATASMSSSPNNNYGWGIPNMCAAHNLLNGTTLGVNELITAVNFKLFPNPAQQQIKFTLNQKPEKVQLTDVLGKVIEVSFTEKDNNQYAIQLNNITKGVYFISVKTADGLLNSKFIKE